MKNTTLLLAMSIVLLSCKAPETPKIAERVFQRRDVSGETVFTVRLRSTEQMPAAMTDLMEKLLTIRRVDSATAEELRFWRETPMSLRADHAEIQVELVPAEAKVDKNSFIYEWPEIFQISRPGVLEIAPPYQNVKIDNTKTDNSFGTIRQAVEVPDTVRGHIRCQGADVQQVTVVVAGQQTQAQTNGTFQITGPFTGVPTRVYVAYDAQINVSPSVNPSPRLQIFNDFHDTRNESVDQEPTQTGTTVDFGDVNLRGNDCVLWNLGVRALTDYAQITNGRPPAGELRIKRWEAVFRSAGAAPHTFYNYIVAPTDLATNGNRERTLFHEFGHTIRHVADGDATHWHGDNFRYIYARSHDGSQVTNKSFVFNEGWANYWATVVLGGLHPVHPSAPGADFLDWNEDLIAVYLGEMSSEVGPWPAGPAFMTRVLTSNPGQIHTLYQFEDRYCAMLGAANRYCKGGRPTRAAPSSCPPGFNYDGLTCRLNNILAKPSFSRGVAVAPNSCGPGREYDAGLCYPLCAAGFHGVGPVCWQDCPPGYNDDGATCRRDANIIGANNSACPWYDKCGLTFARGCSVCPAGFNNDGCTCRIDVHIFAKSTQTRGVGSVPNGCAAGMEYDAGLCYSPCGAGFHGVGPVCWGTCPAGFADHGATCYRDPNIFSDD